MTTIAGKAFAIGEVSDASGGNDKVETRFGARTDISQRIENFTITASVTDSTIRDVEAAPWLKDAIITAETTEGSTDFVIGYDAGAKSAFGGAHYNTDVSGKPVRLGATWFQRGNHIRAEGKVRFDSLTEYPALSASYTFNDEASLGNSTVVNLKERDAFVISPFTAAVANNSVKYQHEVEGYVIEPSYDITGESAFLKVSKDDHTNLLNYNAQYSLKHQTALFEIGKRRKYGEKPYVKAFIRTPVGNDGVGPLSIGFVVDRAFDV